MIDPRNLKMNSMTVAEAAYAVSSVHDIISMEETG